MTPEKLETVGPMAEEIFKRLDKLAEKLGVGAEKIWGFYVKAQFVDGLVSLGLALFGLFVAVVSAKLVASEFKDPDRDPALASFVWILFVLGLSAFFGFGASTVYNLMVPEYEAFREIIGAFK